MAWFVTIFLAGFLNFSGPIASPGIEGYETEVSMAAVSQAENETIDKTYSLNPDGRVSVSNINGSVEVTGWDRPEVHLIAKKFANTKDRLNDLEISIESSEASFDVRVDYKKWKGKWVRGDKLYVNFTLMVPRTAIVDEIESVNGGVTVSELTNVTVVSAVNGAVRGSDLKGKVKLSTVNGSVTATMAQVVPNAEISLETVNGSAKVQLPSNVDAIVKADSVNGSISNDFGLPIKKGKYVGRDLYGKIGTGDAKIRLSSVNGSIAINRMDDGQTVNPVENLLPLKTSDDFDDSLEENLRESIESARKISAEAALTGMDAQKIAEIQRAASVDAGRIAAEAATIAAESIGPAVPCESLTLIDREAEEEELERISRNAIGGSQGPFLVEDSRTVVVTSKPTVEVEAYGCNVTIRGWEKSEINYKVTRLARGAKSPVRGIDLTRSEDNVRLEVELMNVPAADDILEQVRVELYVPKNSNLRIKTDREIRLEGVAGEVDLVGKYGRIDVRDASGQLNVSSKSGIVRVIGFEGDLSSETVNGDQYFEGSFNGISSKSDSGSVYLTVPGSAGAMIRTNSAEMEKMKGKGEAPDGTSVLELNEVSEGLWKLGSGGPEYYFTFKSGKLVVRSIQTIESQGKSL